MSSAEPARISFKKKGKGRPAALRKRSLSPSATAEPEQSAVIQSTRKAAANHLIQGTGSSKRRKQEDELDGVSSDEDEAKLKEANSFIVNHSAGTVRPRRRSSSPPAEVMIQSLEKVEAGEDDGLYRGSAKQQHNLPKSFGPIKGGPSNVRTITLVDYQPDVCKDYKGKPSCRASPRPPRRSATR